MKRWNVIVELPAQKDIAKAYFWLAKRNADAADRWFGRIYKTIGSLEAFPLRAPLAPGSKYLHHEIREVFHGRRHYKYRILFTVTENEVHILHVRHGSRLALGQIDVIDD
jgi:plasmid stabilization system protein ParE